MRTIYAISLALLTIFSFASCSSEPQWADPEAHEKTVQLREQYGPLMVGTWYYESISDKERFFERLTFEADGTLTGMRKWQTRSLVTIGGEKRYTDWKDLELLEGTFTGTWELKYWNSEGNSAEKRNCLNLFASYDENDKDYMAYSYIANFDYANETTLRFQGQYMNGWVNFQRGNAEPSF